MGENDMSHNGTRSHQEDVFLDYENEDHIKTKANNWEYYDDL